MDTVSVELTRIHTMMDACDKAAATLPVRTIIDTLELLALSSEMIEIELALWKGETSIDAARPRIDALIARQMMLQPAGGSIQ